ncbi:myosin-kinesin ATPase superfamily-like protein [Aureococcus anophagefferens]|nr:myosin-kinesin ATPase superfamily-like protein [Aureococcus anophagefferens]
MSAMCFTVHHFAGPVTYDAVGWLEKNADAPTPGGRAKKKGNATIASKFKADLGRLDAQLRDTAPHFARCVKPNQLALPGRFENPLVLRQLKYAGLFEAIRIRKAGYAVRVPLEAFVKRYARTLPASQKAAIRLCDAALSGAGSAVAAADGMRRAYLDAKDLTSAQIAVGKTKVFLRDQKVRGLLEREYEKAVEASIKAIQTWMKAQLKILRKEGSKREARLKKKAAEAARKKQEEEAKAAKAKAEAEEAAKKKAIEEDKRAAEKAIADAKALLAKLAGLLLHIQTSCRAFLARRFADDLDAGLPADLAPQGAVRAAERARASVRTGDAPAQDAIAAAGQEPLDDGGDDASSLSAWSALLPPPRVAVRVPRGAARREPLTYLYGHGFLAAETHAATTLNALLPTLDRKKGAEVAPAENFLSGDALDVPDDAKLPPHVFEALDDARRAILPALKRKALAKADALLPRKKDRDDATASSPGCRRASEKKAAVRRKTAKAPEAPVHDHHQAMTDGERAAAKRIATREMHLHHRPVAEVRAEVAGGRGARAGRREGPARAPPDMMGQNVRCSVSQRDRRQLTLQIGTNLHPEQTPDYAYVVPAHSAAGCCNACAMDDDCESSFYVRGAENQTAENFQGECFGLHITSVEGHSDGNASIAFVEAQFTEKLEGLKSFDAFLDYNAALYTQTLDWYVANLEALGLPWLPATWPYGVEKTGYSVFFHVPKTQLVVELVSLFPPSHNKVAITLEQRMTDDRIAQMGALHEGDPRLLVSSVSRAATNLTAIHDFYRFGLGARQTMGLELADVRKKCFQINGTTADVCFVKRGDDATAGDFKMDGDETKIMPGCEQKAAAKDEANACDSGDPGEGRLYWCDAGTC